jgi:hypothetical protein
MAREKKTADTARGVAVRRVGRWDVQLLPIPAWRGAWRLRSDAGRGARPRRSMCTIKGQVGCGRGTRPAAPQKRDRQPRGMSAAGVEFISISDEDDGAGGGDESAAGAACAGDRDREMAGAPSRASVCVQCRDVRLSERAGTADTADGVQTSHRRTRTYVLHVSVSARRPVAVPVLVRYFDRSLTQRRRRARMIGHDRRGKRAYRMPAGRRRRSQGSGWGWQRHCQG